MLWGHHVLPPYCIFQPLRCKLPTLGGSNDESSSSLKNKGRSSPVFVFAQLSWCWGPQHTSITSRWTEEETQHFNATRSLSGYSATILNQDDNGGRRPVPETVSCGRKPRIPVRAAPFPVSLEATGSLPPSLQNCRRISCQNEMTAQLDRRDWRIGD